MTGNGKTVLPSKKTSNTGRYAAEVRGPAELYPTQPPLTRAFLQVEPLPKKIWEPTTGLGHMSAVLKEAGHSVFCSDKYGYGIDGVFLQDFFDFRTAPQGVSCIVTNPPFSIAPEFIRHGLELCEKVCVYGRLAFLEAAGRSDLIDHKLARVYPFVERCMLHRWSPDENGVYREWSGKKAASAMPQAWFVFDRNHDASKGWVGRRIWWSKPERNTPPDPRKALFDLGREEGKLVLT